MIREALLPTTFVRPEPSGDALGLPTPEPILIVGPQRYPGEAIDYAGQERWRVERVVIEGDLSGMRQTVYVSIVTDGGAL